MKELNMLLNILYDNIETNSDIFLNKIFRNGYKEYEISLYTSMKKKSLTGFDTITKLVITINTQHNYISIKNDYFSEIEVMLENEDMTKEWSKKFEDHLVKTTDSKISNIIHKTIEHSDKNNIFREFSIDKILNKDESI